MRTIRLQEELVLPSRLSVVTRRLRAANFGHSFWALADQSLVSLGTFLTGIILARSLPVAEYGAYGLIFGIMLFVNGLHAALVTHPVLIKGASADDESLRRFASGSLILTLALALPLGAVVLGTVGALGRLQSAHWVLAAFILWQLQEVTRRALMAHLRHRAAVWGDVLRYLGQAGMIWALLRSGNLSLPSVFIVMTLTSGAAVVLQSVQVGLRVVALRDVWRVAKDFWNIGRWMLLTNLVGIIMIQAVAWTLAFSHGTQEAAALYAVANILGATNPVLFSISNLIVPAVARTRLERGVRATRRVAWSYGAQGGALVFTYYLVLMLWPSAMLRSFYGPNSPYLGLEAALCLLALSYTLDYFTRVLEGLLYGLGENRSSFLIQLITTLAVLTISLPLAAWGGMTWALAGGFFSSSIRVAASLFFVRRLREAEAGARHGKSCERPT